MYRFTCPNGHQSYSAAPSEGLSDCPACGGPTRLLGEAEAPGLLVVLAPESSKPRAFTTNGPTAREYVADMMVALYGRVGVMSQ